MDIDLMTDQEILDYIKSRSPSYTVVGGIRCKTIEDFFNTHYIPILCPICGSVSKVKNGYNGSGTPRYKCSDCGKNYSLVSNTIFDGTSYSLNEMVNAVHSVITQQSMEYMKINTSAGKLAQSAVWLLIHKILYILNQMSEIPLYGAIEMDEKYFRETQKGSRSLISYLDPSQSRKRRKHNYRSECGIFGPEFVNTICAVDDYGHYWAKCICLGPMDEFELDKITNFKNVSYICSDNYYAYSVWCKKRGYKHYVEPSGYRKERSARGYIDTDDIYHVLTPEEYTKDEAINRQMYKEGRYPHIEYSDHELSFDEFLAIKNKFMLGINSVNGFHSQLERYLVSDAKGVSSEYLQDYIGTFVYLHNYKRDNDIKAFSFSDAENILAEMLKYTIREKHSPDYKDITQPSIDKLPRPSKRSINAARNHIKDARKIVKIKTEKWDKSEYEGEGMEYAFDKNKFFRDIGTTRLNELAKLYGVYDRNEHKSDRVKRMASLPNAQDIILNEIFIAQYGSVADMQQAFSALPTKNKRGRPKKK